MSSLAAARTPIPAPAPAPALGLGRSNAGTANDQFYLLDLDPIFPPSITGIPLPAGPPRELADGWWHLPEATAGPAWLTRPAGRAVRRLQRLADYLTEESLPCSADVVCQHDTRPGHQGITASSGLAADGSRHHLFTAGYPPTASVRDLAEVSIISGLCLFSSRAAQIRTESRRRVPIIDLRHGGLGERAVALLVEDALTLPEEETCLRLASAGAALAARIPAEVDVTVHLAVPKAATALLLLKATHDGEVPPELLLQWCEESAGRHEQVTARSATRWQSALAAAPTSRPVRISTAPELETMLTYLRHALNRGQIPKTAKLAELAAGEDRLLGQLVKIAPPATPVDLANLSNLATQMRAALGTEHAPRLAVQVENPAEVKIFRRARDMAEAIQARTPNARMYQAGMFPLERMWVNDPAGVRLNLHSHDPGRWAVDTDGLPVDLVEVAASLYPAAAQQAALVPG
ncbi:hypothetical protein ACWDRB_47705 [Nonomuraea sp. NPDC003707]